jgi:hypothetical protein
MHPQPSPASWRLASRLTGTFQGQLFHGQLASTAATPQRLIACLYRRRRFPPITSLRFVAHEVKVPSDDQIAVDAHDLVSLTSICTRPVDASEPSRGNAPDGNFSLTMFVIGVPPMCPPLWPLPRHHWNGRKTVKGGPFDDLCAVGEVHESPTRPIH